jgi:hypothetical protein
MTPLLRALAATLFLALGTPAQAQIAVSSNDHKTSWKDGLITPVLNPTPDTATIIDLNVFPPRILATLEVPGGVSGPPQAVAITPDESLALVTTSSRVDT